MRISEEQIREVIRKKIESDENPGEKSGKSGHLSQTSCFLDTIDVEESPEGFHVSFQYTVVIETEFTYYPDNPPYEYKYSNSVVLSKTGEILEETGKVSVSDGKNDDPPFTI